ncbi:SLC13 family permease [Demequina sp.]|uniref:SLC13 family permease n=1 Tax=Demequina sp. TaxID=2050685 RepID=UPI003D11D3EC
MTPIEITFLILGLAVVAFMTGKIPIAIVAVGVSVSLWATGVLELKSALAGFGDPTVIFIGSLFIVSEALYATGVTAWAGQQAVTRGGTKRVPLLITICLLVALLTALISVNGAVAALVPLVVVVAVRAGLPPSQLLIPLAFAAHAGSLLALTGTPVNIIVSEAAADAGERPFGYLEFAWVGIPLVIGSVIIMALLGKRALPHNPPEELPADIAALTRALRADYVVPEGQELIGTAEGVTEVVIPPRSELIGTHLFTGQTTPSGDLVVLGVNRGGEPLVGPDAKLAAGDSILVRGTWEHLERHTAGPEVLVVNDPASLRKAVPLGPGAKRALVILAAMVLLLVTGWVPPVIAGLLAAGAVILSGVFTPLRAYKAVQWTTVLLVAGMIPLSTAFTETGAADLIATHLKDIIGNAPAQVALLAICLLTMVLGQLISNMATVLIMLPISVSLAADLNLSVLPFLMALTVAGAAAFLTPVATPANTMVLEPGAYKFGDYWKLGLPLLLWFLVVAVLIVPLIWRF